MLNGHSAFWHGRLKVLSSVGACQLEERAEQIRAKSHLIQVEREKMQLELSHKRARVELERAASTSAQRYEVGD